MGGEAVIYHGNQQRIGDVDFWFDLTSDKRCFDAERDDLDPLQGGARLKVGD